MGEVNYFRSRRSTPSSSLGGFRGSRWSPAAPPQPGLVREEAVGASLPLVSSIHGLITMAKGTGEHFKKRLVKQVRVN